MDRLVRTLAVAAIALAVAGPALASASLTVDLNHLRRIMLSGTAANVVVGDPKIADVSIIDAHSIVLEGRGFGATDVLVTDRTGHVLLSAEVVVPTANVVTLQSGPASSVDFSCTPRCLATNIQGDLPKPPPGTSSSGSTTSGSGPNNAPSGSPVIVSDTHMTISAAP
jgi:hypothetical protein